MPEGFAEYLLSFRPSQQKGHGLLAAPFVCDLRKSLFLQVLLVALDHLLDHLAADGTGLAGGQVAVVALLEVDADLPWCTPNILKCLSRVSLRYDKGEQMPGTSQRETGAAPVYREDTIGVMSRSTGLLRQETLELEGPPAHQ